MAAPVMQDPKDIIYSEPLEPYDVIYGRLCRIEAIETMLETIDSKMERRWQKLLRRAEMAVKEER